MPTEFPIEVGDNPRPTLFKFIIATRDFLDELVRTGTDRKGRPAFYPELVREMREAWTEAYHQFEEIARATDNLGESAIQDHGLSGAQLRFKLSVVKFRHQLYLDYGVRRLRRLIEAVDTLLHSILAALHAAEGIKEIKEYIEHSIRDWVPRGFRG